MLTSIISTALQNAKTPPKVCYSCNQVSKKLRICTGCKQAQYCSEDCQKKHLPEHKTSCEVIKANNIESKERKEILLISRYVSGSPLALFIESIKHYAIYNNLEGTNCFKFTNVNKYPPRFREFIKEKLSIKDDWNVYFVYTELAMKYNRRNYIPSETIIAISDDKVSNGLISTAVDVSHMPILPKEIAEKIALSIFGSKTRLNRFLSTGMDPINIEAAIAVLDTGMMYFFRVKNMDPNNMRIGLE